MPVHRKASREPSDLRNADGIPRHRFEACPTFEMSSHRNGASNIENNLEITDAEAEELAPAIVRLFGHWKLDDVQARKLLGGISTHTWTNWKNGVFGHLVLRRRDLRMRMAHLIAVHHGLRKRFSDPESGYEWIRRRNDAFEGRSALDVMLYGEMNDLAYIRERVNTDISMG